MMPPRARRSIAEPTSLAGVGLHTGSENTLTFRPAHSGAGIVFRRVDLPDEPEIRAHVGAVRTTERRTVLGVGDATVDTVEHVLAAVTGLEIDDLCIDIDGPEVPILEGSAAPFVSALRSARPVEVAGEVQPLVVREPIVAREGDSVYRAYPGARTVTVTVEWDHPAIGRQEGSYDLSPGVFEEELAGARTFGFLGEIEGLRNRGLIKGGHLGCAVVLGDSGVINGTLRWADEFVRHKTVDLLGDLALAGGRIDGTIEAMRPSHRGNVVFARAIHQHCATGK